MEPITREFFPFDKLKGDHREILDQVGFSDEKYVVSPYQKLKLKQ
jgi:hypothetical protein